MAKRPRKSATAADNCAVIAPVPPASLEVYDDDVPIGAWIPRVEDIRAPFHAPMSALTRRLWAVAIVAGVLVGLFGR